IQSGSRLVPHTDKAQTVAGALRVNFGAEHTLVAVKESGGFGVALTDEEIIAAERDVAKREGIFCEVSSATALAGIAQALKENRIASDESACAILSGIGFKEYSSPFEDVAQVPLATKLEDIPKVIEISHLS
nr:pyridoxal-phosphate dependent enzyme [Nitrososphaerota archaeon]